MLQYVVYHADSILNGKLQLLLLARDALTGVGKMQFSQRMLAAADGSFKAPDGKDQFFFNHLRYKHQFQYQDNPSKIRMCDLLTYQNRPPKGVALGRIVPERSQ